MTRPVLSRGDQGDHVAYVRQMLKYEAYKWLHARGATDAAYDLMKLPCTNLFDGPMERAVLHVQSTFGLEESGKVDHELWELLDTEGAPF